MIAGHRLPASLLMLACALPLAPVAQAAAPSPELGRLFMTPETRAMLERQRQLNIKEVRSIDGGSMRLDGVVLRSTGKSTVWINNQPQPENASDTGVTAALVRQRPDGATLTTGADTPAELKVGETINRATRETSGGLAAGEIRVHRAAPRR